MSNMSSYFSTPSKQEPLIAILSQLAEERQLKATVHRGLTGGLIAGAAAAIGAVLLGKRGLALGGALGGLTAAVMVSDIVPVATIIRNMSPAKQQLLCEKVLEAIQNMEPVNVLALVSMIRQRDEIAQLALNVVQTLIKMSTDY